MQPFLLLSIRADDAAADNEYASFLSLAGLEEGDLRRVRLDRRGNPPVLPGDAVSAARAAQSGRARGAPSWEFWANSLPRSRPAPHAPSRRYDFLPE